MKELPTERANPAVPKGRGKQSWTVHKRQERVLLSKLPLQHGGACDRGDLICRRDKVPLRKSLGLDSLAFSHPVDIISTVLVDIIWE